MKSYTVYEQPDPPSDRIDRADALVFVRDGFSWFAFLFTPLWLLAHRLWWPLLAYLGLGLSLGLAAHFAGFEERWLTLVALGVGLLFGFEADALRRWGLEHSGWKMIASVSGRRLEDCERRFLDGWLPTQPLIAPPTGSAHLIPPAAQRRGWLGFGRLTGGR